MHWPEFLFLLYIPATVAFFGYSLYMPTDWEFVPNIMITYAVGVLILGSLKILLGALEGTNQTALLKQCKFHRALGFFLITVFGIAIRILPFLNFVDVLLYASPLLVFSVISYFFFIAGTRRYCTWDKTLSRNIAAGVVSINVIVLLLSLYVITVSFDKYQQTQLLYLFQIGFFGLCLAGTQELAEINCGAMKLKTVPVPWSYRWVPGPMGWVLEPMV